MHSKGAKIPAAKFPILISTNYLLTVILIIPLNTDDTEYCLIFTVCLTRI